MATLTIEILNPDEEKRIMERIIDEISRTGFYRNDITDKISFNDLAANHLVQFKIITREVKQGRTKCDLDYYEYREGVNFLEAKLKSPFKFIEDKKKELNPSKSNKILVKISNNPLIVAIISAIIGGLISWFIAKNI